MRVLVATRNRGKLSELRRLLGQRGVELVGTAELGLPDVLEDGDTFEANAIKKATELARASRLLTLADDSGLEVDALHGGPGVYSARYGGGTDEGNVRKLLRALENVSEGARAARFRCVLALVDPADPEGEQLETTAGVCEGRIALAPRGGAGFGYDPVFIPAGETRTMAELSPEEKDARSHRGAACRAMIPVLDAQIHRRLTNPGV